MDFIKVILESPYSGDVETNVRYARACVRDSLKRGEAPLASHLLYTQDGILDDTVPEERDLGIGAGLAWLKEADKHVFYVDRGLSGGMRDAMKALYDEGEAVPELRTLGGEWSEPSQYPEICAQFEKKNVVPFYKVFENKSPLPYGPFSNFSGHGFTEDGVEYRTSEHFYQAHKFPYGTKDWQDVVDAPTPRAAADIGRDRSRPMRWNWDLTEVKCAVMLKALYLKFNAHPGIKDILMSTGDKYLMEDSPIDSYWGCGSDRHGLNYLGRCLMALRAHYRGDETKKFGVWVGMPSLPVRF